MKYYSEDYTAESEAKDDKHYKTYITLNSLKYGKSF